MSVSYFPHASLAAEPFYDFFSPVDSFDSGFDLRDERILENLWVVGLVMQRLLPKLPPSVEADDLHSAGVMGLIDAAQKYDAGREARFRTYAELRVRGAMLDYLRSLSWAPRGLHRREREMEAARATVEQKSCRAATTAELAQEMGISLQECQALLARISRLRMSDDEMTADDRPDGHLHANETSDPHIRLERKEMIDLVWRAAQSLPDRLKLALRLYYIEERNMKEVGLALEVNEARVSQLLSKATAIIRREVDRLLQPRAKDSLPRTGPAGRFSGVSFAA
jgi:RNA polymerase sigma factor for flagellar operon FliA